MAQPSQLNPALVQKGRATGQGPDEAVRPASPPSWPVASSVLDDPPLRPAPPKGEATKQESFRANGFVQSELRAMIFETGRSKQAILEEFVLEGLRRWRAARRG